MSKWVMHHSTKFDPVIAVKSEQIRDIVLGSSQVLCVEKISRDRQEICDLSSYKLRRMVANVILPKMTGLVDPTYGAGVVAECEDELLGFPGCVALIDRKP